MYFIPEKGRLYRWAVHTHVMYRYGITLLIISLLLGGWFFVFKPWFVSFVQYEKAAVIRVGQLHAESALAREAIKKRNTQLKQAEETICQLGDAHHYNQQMAAIFDAAHMASLHINTFTKEKDKQKDWYIKKYVTLSASGSLQQIFQFFSTIKNARKMIQCKQLSLQHTEQNTYTMSCQLECIAVKFQ